MYKLYESKGLHLQGMWQAAAQASPSVVVVVSVQYSLSFFFKHVCRGSCVCRMVGMEWGHNT